MLYEKEALTLARSLPHFLAALNYGTTRLREDHIQWNKRLGAKGEEHAARGRSGLKWHDGTSLHTYIFEAITSLELPWAWKQEGAGDTIVFEGIPIFVSRQRPGLGDAETVQQSFGLCPVSTDQPEWVFKVTMRDLDRIAVPAARRTLADGWPDPDILARPAIPDDKPITMIDYVTEAVLYDRRHDVRLPVFSRSVVLGKAGRRMLNCWSARGVRITGTSG